MPGTVCTSHGDWHLEALHIRFLPDQTEEDNLSCREFIKKADFVNVKSLLSSGKDDEEGENGGSNEGGSNEGGSSQGGSENGGGSSQGGSGTGTITQNTVAAPTISGVTPFEETTTVNMSGPDGAEIHYTTDGSTPSAESTLYSEAFTLSDSATVKAIAIKNGQSSSVSTKVFTKGTSGNEGDAN